MSLIVYQIGDLPVYHNLLSSSASQGISLSLNRLWRAPKESLNASPVTFRYSSSQDLPKSSAFTISGKIFNTEDISVSEFISRLKAQSGKPDTPFILFTVESDGVTQLGVRWFVTYGVVESVNINYDNLNVQDYVNVSITCDLDLLFKRLNMLDWEYRPFDSLPLLPRFDTKPYIPDNLFNIPTEYSQIQQNYIFYRWAEPEKYFYNTLNWGRRYWRQFGGDGSDYKASQGHIVFSDPNFYSSSPRSRYAITNFYGSTGKINIYVNSELVGYINVDNINNSLLESNEEALRPDDEIFFGDLTDGGELVLYRNKTDTFVPIIQYKPTTVYKGDYLGQLDVGYNEVYFDFFETTSTGLIAYLHEYGVY